MGKGHPSAQQKLIGKEQQGRQPTLTLCRGWGDLRDQEEEREFLPMENHLHKMKSCNMYSVFLDQQLNCKEISSAAEVFAKTDTFRGREGLANISDGIIPTFSLGQYATYKHFYLWSKVKQKTKS